MFADFYCYCFLRCNYDSVFPSLQCHRGYTLASDDSQGLMSLNPLYIRNVPDTKVNSDAKLSLLDII